MAKPQYVYLLQEREFVKSKEPVYKIGRTTQEHNKRFKQYPKGSVLLLQSICSDCKVVELEIIKEFKKTFKHRKDIGSEYFEGSKEKMIESINEIVKNFNRAANKEEYYQAPLGWKINPEYYDKISLEYEKYERVEESTSDSKTTSDTTLIAHALCYVLASLLLFIALEVTCIPLLNLNCKK